ncbi:MAG: 4Fe-4S binding protein, partial [Thermodesulfobacteria bacterium]|nr:4Fe-4S binding protein [Thermodesulfobacteriota bacterium]
GLYVMGSIGIVASLVGRMPCAWFCPFGLIQDLLFRLRVPKLRFWPPLGVIRYVMLFFMVILLPIFISDQFGYGQTWFCKYVCPVGTLEAGLPLLALSPDLRSAMGMLFFNKLGLMFFFVGWSSVTRRPFCRCACPLGLLLGFFNKVSWLRLKFNVDTCVDCQACELICPTGVRFATGGDDINSNKCIRCFRCFSACPGGAVTVEFSSIMKGEVDKIEGCHSNQEQG